MASVDNGIRKKYGKYRYVSNNKWGEKKAETAINWKAKQIVREPQILAQFIGTRLLHS